MQKDYNNLSRQDLIQEIHERDADTEKFIKGVVNLLQGLGLLTKDMRWQLDVRTIMRLLPDLIAGKGLDKIPDIQELLTIIQKYYTDYGQAEQQAPAIEQAGGTGK